MNRKKSARFYLFSLLFGLMLALINMGCSAREESISGEAEATGSTMMASSSGEERPEVFTVTGEPATASSSGESTGMGPEQDSGSVSTTDEQTGVCGNGEIEGSEECDDGNDDATDECDNLCQAHVCGDGILQEGEACDLGVDNVGNYGGCNADCTLTGFCGDQLIQPEEVCDNGVNDNSYNGCQPGCQALATERCGDGIVHFEYENCDGWAGLKDLNGVKCTDECNFDFSWVTQMSCSMTCSYGGAPGCDQADADIFCKLRTGNMNATAKAGWETAPPTDAGGFACGDSKVFIDLNGVDPRHWLDQLGKFGVEIPVAYQSTQIKSTHGLKPVLQAATVECQI